MNTTTSYPVIHTACGRPHAPSTPCPVTGDQLDGLACVECGRTDGAMMPVGVVDGAQVFAHEECGPPVTRRFC